MANHKSSKKRIRQTIVRTERNQYYKTRIKNMTKAFLAALEAKDTAKAADEFKKINKKFHHFASKGVLKKNTAARKVSNLHHKLKALEA